MRLYVMSLSPLSRLVWAEFLRGCPEIEVTGCYPGLVEFRAKVPRPVGILLVIPPVSPAIKRWKTRPAHCRVVWMGPDEGDLPACIEVVTDQDNPRAFFKFLLGDRFCRDRRSGKDDGTVMGKLTAKERECLQCMCTGLSLKQIADQHGHSVSTAQTHLNRVMKKLGVTNRADLILAAASRSLVDCPCRPVRSKLPGDRLR